MLSKLRGGVSKRKYKVNIEIAIPQLQQRQPWRVFGPLLIVPVGAGGDESSGRGHVRICPLRRPCKPLSNHRRASRHSPADARTGTPTRPVCRRRARIRDRPGNTFVGCFFFFFGVLFLFFVLHFRIQMWFDLVSPLLYLLLLG